MHLPVITDWPRIGPGAGTAFKKPRKHADLQGFEQGLQHPDHRFKSGCRLDKGPSKDGPFFVCSHTQLPGTGYQKYTFSKNSYDQKNEAKFQIFLQYFCKSILLVPIFQGMGPL